jgi:hypothetical protein
MLPANLRLTGGPGQQIDNDLGFELRRKRTSVRGIEKSPWAVQY